MGGGGGGEGEGLGAGIRVLSEKCPSLSFKVGRGFLPSARPGDHDEARFGRATPQRPELFG